MQARMAERAALFEGQRAIAAADAPPSRGTPLQRVKVGGLDYKTPKSLMALLKMSAEETKDSRNIRIINIFLNQNKESIFADLEQLMSNDIIKNLLDPFAMHGDFTLVQSSHLIGEDSQDEYDYDQTDFMETQREENTKHYNEADSVTKESNFVQASLSVCVRYVNEGRETYNTSFAFYWNSGETQVHDNSNIKKYLVKYVDDNKNKLGPQYNAIKGHTGQATAHSENAAAIGANFENSCRLGIAELNTRIKAPATIVSYVLNLDSFPNTMCMNMCRYSVGTVIKQKLKHVVEASDNFLGKTKDIRMSARFGTVTFVASAVEFNAIQNKRLTRGIKALEGTERKARVIPGGHVNAELAPRLWGGTQETKALATKDKKRKRDHDHDHDHDEGEEEETEGEKEEVEVETKKRKVVAPKKVVTTPKKRPTKHK